MDLFTGFLYLYLTIGIIYALYIWLFAGDSWYAIPINALGGPILILYQIIRAYREKSPTIHELFKDKKAVIFDLDGTIVDSQPFRNEALNNLLFEIEQGPLVTDIPHGLNGLEKWEYILKNEPEVETTLTASELAKRVDEEYLKIYTDVVAMDGFWELVDYLKNTKGFKLGLATNSDRSVTDEVLKRLDAVEVFDFIIAGDEVKRRKPDPLIYKKALKGLGVKVRDVVVFEDTIVGAKAAKKAGLDVIVIWDGEDENPEDFPRGIDFFESDFSGMEYEIEKSLKDRMIEGVAELEAESVVEASGAPA